MSETKDVEITRVLEAPVEKVWRAWSDQSEVRKWWGPAGFTCPVAEVDFREGGTTLVCMRAPQEYGGQDMYNTWSYTTIVPNERIEYIFRFADKEGNSLSPADLGLPDGIPEEGHHVVSLRAVGDGKTEMTMVEHGYTTDVARDLSRSGLSEVLDKMAASVT